MFWWDRAAVTLAGGIGALLSSGVAIGGCTEMTMTLQQSLSANKRMLWLATDGTTGGYTPAAATDCAKDDLVVGALDIRTFVVQLAA